MDQESKQTQEFANPSVHRIVVAALETAITSITIGTHENVLLRVHEDGKSFPLVVNLTKHADGQYHADSADADLMCGGPFSLFVSDASPVTIAAAVEDYLLGNLLAAQTVSVQVLLRTGTVKCDVISGRSDVDDGHLRRQDVVSGV